METTQSLSAELLTPIILIVVMVVVALVLKGIFASLDANAETVECENNPGEMLVNRGGASLLAILAGIALFCLFIVGLTATP